MWISGRLFVLGYGYYWLNKRVLTTKEAGYEKYLGTQSGPERYTGASTIISNHGSYLDILHHMEHCQPSFLAKIEIASYPFIGTITDGIGSFYINRGGNSDERKQCMKDISDRQKAIEENSELPPLLIYPEGSTTNMTSMTKFKIGAFLGLSSIKPVLLIQKNLLFQN